MLKIEKCYILAWDVQRLAGDSASYDEWRNRLIGQPDSIRSDWIRATLNGRLLSSQSLVRIESRLPSEFWGNKIKESWLLYDGGHGYASWRAFIELSETGLLALLESRNECSILDRIDELCHEIFSATKEGGRVCASGDSSRSPQFASLIYVQPEWGSVDEGDAIRGIDSMFHIGQSLYRPQIVGDVLLAGALGAQSINEAATAYYFPHAYEKAIGSPRDTSFLNRQNAFTFPLFVEYIWEYLRYSAIAGDLARRSGQLPLRSKSIRQHLAEIDAEPLSHYEDVFLPARARECVERSGVAANHQSIRHAISNNPLYRFQTEPNEGWFNWPMRPDFSTQPSGPYAGMLEVLEQLVLKVDEKCSIVEADLEESKSTERLLADFFRDTTSAAATRANLLLQQTNLGLQRTVRWLTWIAAVAAVAQVIAAGLQLAPSFSTACEKADRPWQICRLIQ